MGAQPYTEDPEAAATPAANSKLTAVQSQVDTVKDTMAANIELLLNRGEKLDDLDSRADDLGEGAKRFKSSATTVQKKMRWQKWKWRILCALILLVLLGGSIGAIVAIAKG